MCTESFVCPFCNSTFPLTKDTFSSWIQSFSSAIHENHPVEICSKKEYIQVNFYNCPQCGEISVKTLGLGTQYRKSYAKWFYPSSKAKQIPEYVPETIREDYEEAYNILELSPKSSATLARRCLQGMIRDKWNVNEQNLYKEINAIKDKIDPVLWKSLDALRQIGNIGAHMEKDTNTIIPIDPKEAEKLVLLIEILIHEWYIVPHDREELFQDILNINQIKQGQRDKSSK